MIRNKSAGFSLLEVLITILLTAIGILGMVAMQGKAIQYTQDSVERTYAAMLANELLEIIRATPDSLDSSNDSPFFNSLPSASAETCIEVDNQIMQRQLGCWAAKARQLLPGAESLGDLFVACVSSEPGVCNDNGSAVEIRMAWNASGEGCLDANNADGLDSARCTLTFRSQI